MMSDDRWLSVNEIAEYLGVRKETIYRWMKQRQMPSARVGKLWKFQKAEVDAWLRSGKAAE